MTRKAGKILETRKAFWEGCRDCLPLMIGAVPVGILCGAMAPAAGFSPAETLVMAVAVFSGAAQFIAISVIMAGPVLPGWIIVGAFLVNAHNLLLGASLAAHMDRLPLRLRLLLALGLTDGTYALTMNRILASGFSVAYMAGAVAVMAVFWVAANAAGVFVGDLFPAPLDWGLDFTLTAVFIAILVPQLRDRVCWTVAAVAGAVAVPGALIFGGKWYILAACGAAMATGVVLEGRMKNAG